MPVSTRSGASPARQLPVRDSPLRKRREESRLRNASTDELLEADATTEPTRNITEVKNANKSWGRSAGVSWFTWVAVACIFLFCPLMVIYVWMACDAYQCSLWAPVARFVELGADWKAVQIALLQAFPRPTIAGFQLYFGWLLFQAALYAFLPSKIGYGQRTPAGHMLPYKVGYLC
jgi:7-dehydrocholesterol reductase